MIDKSDNMELTQSVTIRQLLPSDSLSDLTNLLHRAYAPLAEQGMRYLATHQDESVTRDRVSKGECYVAILKPDILIGTIVFVPHWIPDDTEYYNQPLVAWFQQFAVEPEFQGMGIGSLLMDCVEKRATETGALEIALDTSENAIQLISLYKKRGYEIVAQENWDCTNCISVIMRKRISEK